MSEDRREIIRASGQNPKKSTDFYRPMDAADKRFSHLRELFRRDPARQWTLAEMAREVNLSVSHLNRIFKAETGFAPLRFLREMRLKIAAELLQNSFLSVKEIRCRAGLWDKSAFIRDFKKKFGITPTEYRNQTSENPPAEFDNLAEGKSA
jgi:AraC-like DNA-binding protein